jgi:hypothetical protein
VTQAKQLPLGPFNLVGEICGCFGTRQLAKETLVLPLGNMIDSHVFLETGCCNGVWTTLNRLGAAGRYFLYEHGSLIRALGLPFRMKPKKSLFRKNPECG